MSTLPASSSPALTSGWFLSGLLLLSPAALPAAPIDDSRILGSLLPAAMAGQDTAEPRARVYFEPTDPAPEEPFDLVIELQWSHEDRPAALEPPRFDLPPGLDKLSVRTLTSDSGQGAQATWYITLTAAEAGSFRLAPLTLSWQSAAGPGSILLPSPRVTVGSRPNPGKLLTLLLGLGGLGTLLALTWGRRRRPGNDTHAASPVDEDLRQQLEAAWREARRRRMAGDRAAAVERLVELERELGGLGVEAPALAGQPLEEIRYGGRLPSGPELDHLERRVERALMALRPDTDEPPRRASSLGERAAGQLWRKPS